MSFEGHGDVRSLQLTLGLYIVIFAGKLAVYFVSGIMALLAEALHTMADVLVTGFLLIAVHISRRRPDPVHMFGYGRAQNVAALVAATIFISFTSFELYREAIPHLFHPRAQPPRNPELAIAVLLISMLIAAVPLIKLMRGAAGPAAKAQLQELVNDQFGLLAALLGTVCLLLGYPIADPLAAVVVATIIAFNAIGLFRENSSILLGKAPPDETMAAVETAARSVPGVLGIHELRVELVGPGVAHATMHIQVTAAQTVAEGHNIARQVDRLVEPLLGNGFCEIHVDPLPVDAATEV
ncbi:MAG TPA: cation diffusion facilitator family transporter [Thermoanaerobaculaceae bacterium]|nr:cation diffusion facilitator family transporter [Thermoanaerobaculaceae bacterium]HPS79622.1 cation diffusion facilitator family transporter [Thermoanaerobaculaceae bacterium]